jgi:hypothetical protein
MTQIKSRKRCVKLQDQGRALQTFRHNVVAGIYSVIQKQKGLSRYAQLRPEIKSLAATYSPTLLCAVPSAMKGLTSEFGMGSGISLSLMSPS